MQQRWELIEIMKDARQKGNQTMIRYSKLIVNGQAYTVKKIKQMYKMGQLEQYPKIPQANTNKIHTETYGHRSANEGAKDAMRGKIRCHKKKGGGRMG